MAWQGEGWSRWGLIFMGTLRLHYEENNILRPIGALILLKLKVTKIPIQIGPFSAPLSSITFLSTLEAIDYMYNTCIFPDALDHEGTHGNHVLQSIALGKSSTFFMVHFSSVALYDICKEFTF